MTLSPQAGLVLTAQWALSWKVDAWCAGGEGWRELDRWGSAGALKGAVSRMTCGGGVIIIQARKRELREVRRWE